MRCHQLPTQPSSTSALPLVAPPGGLRIRLGSGGRAAGAVGAAAFGVVGAGGAGTGA